MTFKNFIQSAEILKALQEAGYESPTPIQAESIPAIKKGSDLRASAQTGTGKTAAFLLPVLERLTTPSTVQAIGPRVLILVPTRELAMQVAQEAAKYSKYLSKVKTVCIYGGAPYPPQNRDLSKHHEILVATPGRLMDHMQQGRVNFSRLEVLILDEADRMLDMGFIDAVEEIAEATPPNRQTLLFSATMKGAVLNLSKRLLKNPVEISVAAEYAKHEFIEQRLHHVDNIEHKYRLLDHLLDDATLTQAIVFTSTKYQADQLADKLSESGVEAAVLHGGMRQSQRTRTIMLMRKGHVRVLVATDVAARGIDVPTISHVINFDLPNNAEDYVHRIGRTGRAGANGVAFSFAAARDSEIVRQIERFTGQKIEILSIPGFEAQKRNTHSSGKSPAPPQKRRQPFSSNKGPNRPFSAQKSKSFKEGPRGPTREPIRSEDLGFSNKPKEFIRKEFTKKFEGKAPPAKRGFSPKSKRKSFSSFSSPRSEKGESKFEKKPFVPFHLRKKPFK